MSEEFSVALVGRLKHGALVEAMAAHGWTQSDLADALDADKVSIGRIVNMQAVPSRKWLTQERQAILLRLTGKLPEDLWPEWMNDGEWLARDKRIGLVRDVQVSRLLDGHAHRLLAEVPEPDSDIVRQELASSVRDALKTLTPREEKVLTLLHGLDGGEQRTLLQVAKSLGLTQERVRQIKLKAFRKLRHPSRSKKLAHFVMRTHRDDVKTKDWDLASWREWFRQWESETPLEQSDAESTTV